MSTVCLSMMFPGVKCPFPGNVAKGRVTPTLTEYLYRDYIFVRCDQGYKLMTVRCLVLNNNRGDLFIIHCVPYVYKYRYLISSSLFSVRKGRR